MVIWLGLMPVTATTSLPKSTEKEPTESASMETLEDVFDAWDTESRRHHVRGEGILHGLENPTARHHVMLVGGGDG